MKGYQLDGNKEMVALGTMNIVGSMTSCYVATGGETKEIFELIPILLKLQSKTVPIFLQDPFLGQQ